MSRSHLEVIKNACMEQNFYMNRIEEFQYYLAQMLKIVRRSEELGPCGQGQGHT
jgi:hypothetical protein